MSISVEHSDMERNKSRLSFLLVVTAFVVPIILAKLALNNHWFNYGVTNQGQLVNQPTNLADLELDFLHANDNSQQKWLLIFNMPSPCLANCLQSAEILSNTYKALGKDVPRVAIVGISEQSITKEQLNISDNWRLVSEVNKNEALQSLPQVFIVDPLGNVVITHSLPTQEQALINVGKAIVADFYKLLKYSRIG